MAMSGFAHRADGGGAAAAGDILTKLTVVLLSSVNAAMWWVYTESRLMGAVWAVIAIIFAVWMKRDAARR
jgi:membrane protein YdbS with pleckstrin-like domain